MWTTLIVSYNSVATHWSVYKHVTDRDLEAKDALVSITVRPSLEPSVLVSNCVC